MSKLTLWSGAPESTSFGSIPLQILVRLGSRIPLGLRSKTSVPRAADAA
jgi:hypothetical protein